MAGSTAAKFFSRTFDRHRNDRGHKRTLLSIAHFGLDLQSVSRVQLSLRLLPGPELLEVVLESFILAVNFPAFFCALLLGANSERERQCRVLGCIARIFRVESVHGAFLLIFAEWLQSL